MFTYEVYNKFLRDAHDKGEQEWWEDLGKRMERIRGDREKLLNTHEGESLGIEELSEIYM